MRFRGVAYRAHDPRWSFQPLSGEGARMHGGRFNAPGTPALYLSLSPATALAEANHGFSTKIQPSLIVAYDVDCAKVLDLTSITVIKHHKISEPDVSCGWLNYKLRGEAAPSWRLAERLVSEGFNGIVVRSFLADASNEDINLVLWNWSHHLPTKVIVHDPDHRLPKDQSSWTS